MEKPFPHLWRHNTMENDLQIVEEKVPVAQSMSSTEVLKQVQLIQEVMSNVMVEGEHYGVIPGTGSKHTLLKAGAEKLCLTFRLHPEFKVERHILDGGHREYEITCRLLNDTGGFISEGVAICTSMETKYRYRRAQLRCPKCGISDGALMKSKRDPEYFCWGRKGGCGATFPETDAGITGQPMGRQENPDLADTYNTVKKIAKKRALVDATITATAASDIFAQDLEEGEPASPIPREEETRTGLPKQSMSFEEIPTTSTPVPRETPPPPTTPPEEGEGSIQFVVKFLKQPSDGIRKGMKEGGFRYDASTYTWVAPNTEASSTVYEAMIAKVKQNSNIVDWDNTHMSKIVNNKQEIIKPVFPETPPPPNFAWREMKSEMKIDFLKECQERKAKMNIEDYYKILRAHGMEKSNDIHPNDGDLMAEVIKVLDGEALLSEHGL